MAKMNWGRVRKEAAIRQYGSEGTGLPSEKDRAKPDGRCPECGRRMERREHPKDWKPDPKKAFYFAYWHWCKPCKRIQLYEKAKRFHNESHPKPPDDIALAVLKEMELEKPDYSGPAPWE